MRATVLQAPGGIGAPCGALEEDRRSAPAVDERAELAIEQGPTRGHAARRGCSDPFSARRFRFPASTARVLQHRAESLAFHRAARRETRRRCAGGSVFDRGANVDEFFMVRIAHGLIAATRDNRERRATVCR
jgi:hypothetical protein